MLWVLLVSLGLLVLGGVGAFLAPRRTALATALGAGSAIGGSAIGAFAALFVLVSRQNVRLAAAWDIPYGHLALEINELSSIFLLCLFCLAGLTALYGASYLQDEAETKSLGTAWLLFNLLVAFIAVVFTARNGILFLSAWEGMTITSFFLVTFHHEQREARDAGWAYLVIAHIGTAFLLAFFALAMSVTGSLDFDPFPALATSGAATPLFLLMLVGFGAKAGLVPLHIWLPEAHPAADSHVSALMSGVMIKTGIFGILLMLPFLGNPPLWWALVLILEGVVTGGLGVAFALAQHNLKRLLAYSSVENMGIITLEIGIGVWGMNRGLEAVALLGFTAALFHVVSHALFKSLLFLGAGAVQHSTHNLAVDQLGGLAKAMPVTTVAFAIGTAAIVGLPPLNGFVSEFLLLSAALQGAATDVTAVFMPIIAVAGIAAISGLAAVTFAKAFGITFLGTPRSVAAEHGRECSIAMLVPLVILAILCIVLGLAAAAAVPLLAPATAHLTGMSLAQAEANAATALSPLQKVVESIAVLALVLAGLALLRRLLLARRTVSTTVTWDCGYERPTARMQYTGSSFAQLLVDFSRFVIRPRRAVTVLDSYFPGPASFSEEVSDLFTAKVYSPLLGWIEWASARMRFLQHGHVHIYLLYIFVTLLVLLLWAFGFPRVE